MTRVAGIDDRHPAVSGLRRVLETIAAAGGAGDAQLVAVTKTYDADAIRPVLDAGHRLFGENRVQEAKSKWPALRDEYEGIELHLIGPLQSNKAKEAVALFDMIESVDRVKIATAIAKAADSVGRMPRCLVQVNIGREPQKAGVAPEETAALLERCRELGLPVEGLMTIPPVDEPPAPHFAALRALAEEHGLKTSMGMSGDYEEAVRQGAHWVRVGSAIFGTRPPLR